MSHALASSSAGLILSIALFAVPGLAVAADIVPVATDAPAGTYHTDAAHTRVMFSVSHLGFSNFTAFFRRFDAELEFDPAEPETMKLTASVDTGSVETLYPDDSYDFNAMIAGKELLDAAAFPEATFVSTGITLTAPNRAEVAGDFTLHGVTLPMTFDVVFNGGYAGHPLDAGARIGFSAVGTFSRSAHGVGFGVPPEGTTMGVFDEVTIRIETEMLNPDAPKVTD